MKNLCLKAGKKDKALRLDHYIISNLGSSLSRSLIQRLIKTENILVNNKPAKAGYKVKENDLVLINLPAVDPAAVEPEAIPLEVIFEDQDFLIINKPAGMVTHPGAGNYEHTLVSALLNYGCGLSSVNGPLRPGIVHRLDKDTSGLMIVAKNNFAHQALAGDFRSHKIERKYIAIVQGRLEHNQGLIDYPLTRDEANRKKIKVSFRRGARPALTKYSVLKRNNDTSVLELTPHTGRTHQLRVHLKFIGHPILGDSRYGKKAGFSRLALHAIGLGFHHPRTKQWVEFKIGLPKELEELMGKLR